MDLAAILFDMDGVLIDSEPIHKLSKERAFARAGITLPSEVYDRYKGRPEATMMAEVAASMPDARLDAQQLVRWKREEFEAIEHLAQPVEGSREFVLWARERFRLALATSATPRNRQAALERLGLSEAFEVVVDASGFSRPKPDPEVFQASLRGLALPPESCVVIEDSLHGVAAAKAAGCRVVALTTSFSGPQLRQAGADEVIGRFAELRDRPNLLYCWTAKLNAALSMGHLQARGETGETRCRADGADHR